MRIALGNSFMTIVVAEILGARNGLGYFVNSGMLFLDLALVFSGIITLGILGFATDLVFGYLSTASRASLRRHIRRMIEGCMNTLSSEHRLTNFAAGLSARDLPAAVVAKLKELMLDSIGIALAGSTAPGVDAIVTPIREWGGKAESSVVGHNLRAPPPLVSRARERHDGDRSRFRRHAGRCDAAYPAVVLYSTLALGEARKRTTASTCWPRSRREPSCSAAWATRAAGGSSFCPPVRREEWRLRRRAPVLSVCRRSA